MRIALAVKGVPHQQVAQAIGLLQAISEHRRHKPGHGTGNQRKAGKAEQPALIIAGLLVVRPFAAALMRDAVHNSQFRR